ncbi:HNH endonuclease signature motif containing protein [Mycolicibacterium pyrenivorans]|uniref:HNH endonuclease signature motif containing protein n=1 Tax=Mycolicibacterium pyrenivorans TaxID=187102 RepID=UPI0021F2DB2E|nr:HNH endonuclease signature motif containing protein [Mycolicibacterium pyrenivorans]MCV7151555.1 DUF222 domain-containing protein [Mycolicibacterium pyrenivorans]
MFDTAFAGLDESELIAAIAQAAREEAAAGARKSAAIAQLVHLTVTYDDEGGRWVYDSWAEAASELGAVLNIGQKRASGQMRIAVALRERLPKIAALFIAGRLSARLISEITWRTRLVDDAQLLALLDAALAEQSLQWGPLSDVRLIRAIDALIDRYDPDAVIRAREVIKTRDFHIGAAEDPDELVLVWGQLLGCDAAMLSARITAMVKGICDNDRRTMGERRSCAVGAIIAGQDHLPCRCGSPECAATAPPKSNVVISVIADPAAIEAAQQLIAVEDREQHSARAEKQAQAMPAPEPEPEPVTPPEPAAEPDSPTPADPEVSKSDSPRCLRDSGVALLPGVKILPIVALAEAIRGGAAIKQLWLPGPDPEPHYRPSAKLAAFVRARDLFCRHPGCDVPAEHCDIDHVTPWPYGPTHASNLNCKCRTHHIGKTFAEGWHDEQLPDGTVIWTSPAGQRATTVPGSRLIFPGWDTTTAELPPMAQPPPDPGRTAKMPKRRRTRAADNAARIKAEREYNAAQRALEHQRASAAEQHRQAGLPPPQPHPDYGDDPPPF